MKNMKTTWRRLPGDRSGTILVMTALLMPVFVGAMALGAEVSYWYFTQRKLQNSADVAAYAGAVKLRFEKDADTIAGAAKSAAINSGYRDSIGVVDTNWPPLSGAFVGDMDSVEVTVTENVPRLFTSLFFNGTVPLSGRAVAQIHQGESACILALHQTAGGAVTFSGSSDTELIKCNVHSNSIADDSVLVKGSSDVEMPCVSAVGKVDATSGLDLYECAAAIEHASPVTDPFAGVLAPSLAAPCEPKNKFGGGSSKSYTISPGRYCGGLTLQREATLDPGVYIVDGGDLQINSKAEVSGSDVTFYLVNGGVVKINGTAELDLSAPTSGTYSDLLVFVDRNEPYSKHFINGDSDSELDGGLYAPSAHMQLTGSNTADGGCIRIVALTIEVTGAADFGADCTGAGFAGADEDQLVLLKE